MNITDSRYSEVAEYLNGHCGLCITGEEVKKAVAHDAEALSEIANECYTDTLSRDQIVHDIAMLHIGMRWPMYGDSEEYKTTFFTKAKEAGIIY